jgi:hypothetical protein
MKDAALIRAATILVGFALVRVLDGLFPWALPVGTPEWVLVATVGLKYGSGTWLTHSVVRRFLSNLGPEPTRKEKN